MKDAAVSPRTVEAHLSFLLQEGHRGIGPTETSGSGHRKADDAPADDEEIGLEKRGHSRPDGLFLLQHHASTGRIWTKERIPFLG
jgi:hypothetical protein